MAHSEILEPFERMLAEIFPSDAVRAIEAGGDWQTAWDSIAASGFLDALAPEARDGFGLDWSAAGSLFQALGRHAVPLPVGETMILRAHLKAVGAECPDGPLLPMAREALSNREFDVASFERVELDPETARVPLALMYAAQIAGAAARLLDMSVAYANERVQFGKPIGRQQAVQQQLAVMAQEVVATRLAVELACSARETPDMIRVASAKSIASRYAASVAATAHAVHGAIGISAEYDLQLLTRRLHSWRLAAGSESYWDRKIGHAALESPETALDWVRGHLHG